MTRKGTLVQGALAAAALSVAYLLTQTSQSAGLDEAVIIEARAADILSLKYFDGQRHYTVTPDQQGDAGALRVHVTGTQRVWARGAPPDSVPDREIRGGRLARDLWAAFAPFKALRRLGKLPAQRLTQLGLADTPRRLVVNVRGIERTFRLALPPPGAVEPYLLSEDDGHVFIVHRVIMNSFSERALGVDRPHEFLSNRFDRLAITPVGRTPHVIRALRGEGTDVQLMVEGALASQKSAIEVWHADVFSMSVDDVLGPEEEPSSGAVPVAFRLEYWLGRDRQGWMDLGEGTFRGERRLFFRSENSFGWMVGAAGSQDVLAEAQKLFGG